MKETVLLLGGSSGIGEATLQSLLKNNYQVLVVDINQPNISGNYNYMGLDLADDKKVKEFILYLKETTDTFKYFINTTGYQENIDILNITESQFKRMFQVTFFSVTAIMQAFSEKIILDKISGASMVNVTSIHDQIIREIAHYSSAKAALLMFSKEMAIKMAKYNTRVNVISPGAIDTPLLRKDLPTDENVSKAGSLVPLGRVGFPKEVANTIMFLISDDASYITGINIVVDGGLSLTI